MMGTPSGYPIYLKSRAKDTAARYLIIDRILLRSIPCDLSVAALRGVNADAPFSKGKHFQLGFEKDFLFKNEPKWSRARVKRPSCSDFKP